jgi:hypothetical protein
VLRGLGLPPLMIRLAPEQLRNQVPFVQDLLPILNDRASTGCYSIIVVVVERPDQFSDKDLDGAGINPQAVGMCPIGIPADLGCMKPSVVG